MYYTTNYISPLCSFLLASDGTNLTGLWLNGQKYHGSEIVGETVTKDDLPIFKLTKNWLDRYFNKEKPAISELPLSPSGSIFRKKVWDILCEIPYGEYITYGDIAKRIAVEMDKSSMSGQAIGGAVGHNPISIIIPCHRVVSSNGSLTGYAGGIDKKIKLLEHEQTNMSQLFIPKKGTAL